MELSAPAARVLGCLIEKQLATPGQYPLTLNALRGACNQSTNRDPVTDMDERAVRDALAELRELDLGRAVGAPGSRTVRYAHLVEETWELGSAALAVVALLLLRGPQTAGELRARSERLHAFATTAEVHDALGVLADHHFGALVATQERRPGQKETRVATTLTAPPDVAVTTWAPVEDEVATAAPRSGSGAADRGRGEVGELRAEVVDLRAELDGVRAELAELTARVERLDG